MTYFFRSIFRHFWFVVSNQPIIIASIRVPNNVVQHDKPFEFKLKLLLNGIRQRFTFKASDPVVCILVTFHKQLKWPSLKLWHNFDKLLGVHVSFYANLYSKNNVVRKINSNELFFKLIYLRWQSNPIETSSKRRKALNYGPLSSSLLSIKSNIVKSFTD